MIMDLSIVCVLSNILIFFLLSVSSIEVFAQEASIQTHSPKSSTLTPEFNYQIHSLPLRGSQMIGPGFSYELSRTQKVGMRYLLSTVQREEQRLSVFWRLSWGVKYFHWILEPNYSYLWRRPVDGGSYSASGLSTGINMKLSDSWSFGGLLGLEQTGSPFPFGTFWSRPSLILFTQFEF